MPRLLGFVFIFAATVSYGQIEEVRRITKQLCAPEFHGRGYVFKGDSLAADFLANEFKAIGVGPIGDSYFQNFTLDVNTFPGSMNAAMNGQELKAGEDFIVSAGSNGYSGLFNYKVINGSMVTDPDQLGQVIQDILSDKDIHGALIDFVDLAAETRKDLYGFGRELSAIMPVVELTDSKFVWSVSREQSPNMYLELQDASYEEGAELVFDIDSKFIKNYRSQNVIAQIPAKKKCAKTIVFSAHYDHLGRMGDEIYFPGANDNASGTAMLITMAKYFKENPSKYNIVFIAFAGEEAGLVGSKYYVENPLFRLKKIKFLLNLDIMGSGEEGITTVNATLFEDEFKLLQTINEEKNLLAKVKSRGPAANSDHYWFTEKKVPAFFIYTMGPNKHYHDVFDTYEELTFNEYHDITSLLVEFVERLK